MSDGRLVRPHVGWQGQFTTQQQPGAIPNGTRIRKRSGSPGDQARVGSVGHVLGSLRAPSLGLGYFVEWDHFPRTAVFIMGSNIVPIAATDGRDTRVHVWSRHTPL
jgi:hypothetical protein